MGLSAVHLLIIDDSPEDRQTYRWFLCSQAPDAYTLTEADRGDRALAALQTARPDCVLLDHRLPDMDGLALLAAIRAQSDVPVVMLTGVGSEALAVECLQRGAQDYLVKGALTPERLRLTIQQAVAAVRLARERDQTMTLLSTVLAALPVGVAVLDADLCLRQGNPALASILGQPASALPGQALAQIWPDLAEKLAAPCAEVLCGARFSDLELHLAPTGGHAERWLLFSGTPVRDAGGDGLLALVTAQDTTARRQAEAAKRASEARLRALIELDTDAWRADGQPAFSGDDLTPAQGLADRAALALVNARLHRQVQAAQQAAAEALARLDGLIDSAPSGIAYLDRALRYQLVNPALAAINGRAPEEHLGRTPRELIPGLAPRLEPRMRQVLATGEVACDMELHGKPCPADGEAHDWLISYFPVRGSAGLVTGVGVTVTDVTASKRTAAALRDTERKLGVLFELLPVGVSILDGAGELAYVNPALEQILRMSRAGLVQGAQMARPYFRPDGTARPLEELVRSRILREHGAILNQVSGFRTEAGEEVWINSSGVRVDFPDWRAVLITADVTQRKQAEDALRASEARQAFLLQLSDRLHALDDPEAIQFEAACTLGRHLGVSRVGYAEHQPDGETIVVTRNYTDGVPSIEGQYRYADYGTELLRAFQANRAVVRPDVANDPTLTDAEKAARALLQLGATVNVPLLKAGRLVAVLFMHHHTARAWSAEEITLLEDVAARTWDAVERARAEATLRQQAVMLDHAHILIRDAENRIVFWNQGAQRLYGWAAEEASGRISHELFQTRFPTSLEGAQAQLLADGHWEGELAHTRRDGAELLVASHQVVFRDPAGRPLRILEVNNDITALRRAERALRERDEQLRLAHDAAELGTWWRDPASDTIYLDERAQAHFGMGPEVPVDAMSERVHPDDRGAWRAALLQTLDPAGDGRAAVECRVTHPDGAVRWLAIHARGRFASEDATRRMVMSNGTSQDITAHKQEEAALRASEANLQAVFASTTQSYILLDMDLRLIQWNTIAASQLLATSGRPPRDGDPIQSYMRPETAAARTELMRRALMGERVQVELEVPAPAAPRWYETEYAPVRQPDGQIRGVCISFLDVTARHQTEVALRASEERFRLLAEQAQDMIYRYRLAPEPGFEYVSPAATLITGYTPEEHYTDPQIGFKLVEPEDRHLLGQLADGLVAGPQVLRWQRKDGTLIWTEQMNRLFFDEAGRPVAIEGIARDITARKAAEEQARAALAAEQQARAEAELAAEQTRRLQAVTAALAATLTLSEVVQVILNLGQDATGASVALLALLSAAGDALEQVGPPLAEAPPHMQEMPLDAPLPMAQAARGLAPVWIEAPALGEAAFPGFGAAMGAWAIGAYAGLPLVTAEGLLGVLALGFATARPFPEDERALLLAMAQQYSQAIARARLYDEVQEAKARLQSLSQRLLETQEQERRHLARELHDEVGQELTGLRLALELAAQLPVEERDGRLAEAHRATRDLIGKMRSLSLNLRPAMLDDMGLLPALLWQLKRYSEQTGIRVDFRHWGLEGRLPTMVETVAYRVVQEALTNIARHAGVRVATVSVLASAERLQVQVRDAGRGFDLEEALAAGRSSGLTGMYERVSLLGGTLSIETAPGAGTCVTVRLPLVEGRI